MRCIIIAASAASFLWPALAVGQVKSLDVERSVNARAGAVSRVAVIGNIKDDCTSGPLPTIKLLEEPKSGKLQVKRGNIRVTNHKKCLMTEVPGVALFYRSDAKFSGADRVQIEISYGEPQPRVERRTITINVKGAGTDI